MNKINVNWISGDPYDYFMGRWSSLIAPKFIKWLNMPPHISWLDVGCGTGALSEAIAQHGEPQNISCIDTSEEFIKMAKKRLSGNGEFVVANVSDIPFKDNSFNIVASGLSLNFFPNIENVLSEMKRVTKPDGTIAAYVWDYADRMDFLRYFWDSAYQVDSKSRKLDEGIRFPICNSGGLINLFQKAGLINIESSALDIYTVFKNFEDYWKPFLGGQGPAPGYINSLDDESKEKLKNNIHERLPTEPDGSIKLLARAITIKGLYR
ncbi:MAG: class I SAM-dependent methyltransferase [Bacteroidota bacterium]